MKKTIAAPIALILACASPLLRAEDVFRSIALSRLMPDAVAAEQGRWDWAMMRATPNLAEADGAGDAALAPVNETRGNFNWTHARELRLIVRLPDGAPVKGRVLVRGKAPAQSAKAFDMSAEDGEPATSEEFHRAKVAAYSRLLDADLPGEGWFRHQRELHRAALKDPMPADDNPWTPRRIGRSEWMDLFTGREAVRANLQADRPLRLNGAETAARTVAFDSLPGIRVKEFDWDKVIKPGPVELDTLAKVIPADQHAVFFRTFSGMMNLFDAAEASGTPLLTGSIPRADDARTRERYPRQICLESSEFAKLAGPHLVSEVAFTGSDFLLPSGSDIGVAFRTTQPDMLKSFILAKQALAKNASRGAMSTQGDHAGVAWAGVATPDRRISSYVAARGDTVFVSNSRVQLQRMIDAATGATSSIASLKEYTFFRQRYPRANADEAAFAFMSDATLRRWCSPRWRILADRRARTEAALAEEAAATVGKPGAPVPASPEYGALGFLTPIAELSADKATPEEAEAYCAWRDSYESGWSAFFDPIAVSLSSNAKRYAADITVMPVFAGSEYREMINFTKGGAIRPGTGAQHAGSLLQYALAIDPKSPHIRRLSGELRDDRVTPDTMQALNALKPDPLAWLGTSLAISVDDDPVLKEIAELLKTKDEDNERAIERFMTANVGRLPISLWVDSQDPTSLAFFMTALRTKADTSAPGMFTWTPTQYKGGAYVTVAGAQGRRSLADRVRLHYHLGKDALFLTLSESVMKAYLDRLDAPAKPSGPVAKEASPTTEKASPVWLGQHAGFRCDRRTLELVESLALNDRRDSVRRASWSVIPVLNELRRAAPAENPVALYERLWGARPACPAGGKYVWNATLASMESTATGCPLAPKDFTPERLVVPGIASGNFGLTFEHDGVRARVELTREFKAESKQN